ncbi:hypothetical protein [Aliamphritea ceti]|uniref:hypothetical protein n=1 Tax=Aliamphritea ceti TaxID=1524258 RepID=UPI0021C4B2AD|nr:hypothetical protein [Aliamphritea ceti]
MYRLFLAGLLSFVLLIQSGASAWAESAVSDDSAYILYFVNDGQIEEAESYQPEDIDHRRAEKIWQVFAAIIPAKQLYRVQEYYVNGPENDGGASVIAVDSELRDWQLSIDEKSVELNDRQDMQDLAFLLIHEFGHILTLNHEQIDADYMSCEATIELEEGCAKDNSYIDLFVKRFWNKGMLTFAKTQDAATVYRRYTNHFVHEYAATNPVEDIAESFSIFVEEDEPENCGVTVADQKVCFFYEFSELIILRSQIRAGVSSL